MPRHNDWFDRIKIDWYNYKKQGSVTIFENPDCTGMMATFPSEVGGGMRSYNLEDMEKAGIQNDHASAVVIPVGYQVELCEHTSF